MGVKKENKPDYAQLSLKIDKELSDKVENYWRKNLYQDKTSFVREALAFYVDAVRCELCGAVNPKGASHCALCGAAIGDFAELKLRIFKELEWIEERRLNLRPLLMSTIQMKNTVEKKIMESSKGLYVKPHVLILAVQHIRSISTKIEKFDKSDFLHSYLTDKDLLNVLRAIENNNTTNVSYTNLLKFYHSLVMCSTEISDIISETRMVSDLLSSLLEE